MKDNPEKLPYQLCKYRVANAAIIFPDGKEHEINGELDIPYLVMKKDFDNEQYPFLSMTCTVSNKLYRKMKQYNDRLRFRLNIRYALFDKGALAINATNVDEHQFICKTFYLYLDDNSPSNQDNVITEIEDHTQYGAYDEDVIDLNHATTVRFSLYDENAISIPKQLSKAVLHAVTPTDVITYLIQPIARFTKILMSPASNNKMYNQFILPPEQLDYQIDRVASEYNLHDNGTIFFFDYDRLYLTEKVNKCTAWEPREVQRIYIVSIPTTKNEVLSSGAYYDNEANEIYLTTKSQTIETTTMANEIQSGSGILVINKRTGTAESFVIDGGKIKAAPKFTGKDNESAISYDKTIVINTGEDTIKALKRRLNEKAIKWTVYLDATMVDALKPNREYQMVFADPDQAKKYNGTYRLVSIAAEFDVALADSKWRGVNTVATFLGYANSDNANVPELISAANSVVTGINSVSNLVNSTNNVISASSGRH